MRTLNNTPEMINNTTGNIDSNVWHKHNSENKYNNYESKKISFVTSNC